MEDNGTYFFRPGMLWQNYIAAEPPICEIDIPRPSEEAGQDCGQIDLVSRHREENIDSLLSEHSSGNLEASPFYGGRLFYFFGLEGKNLRPYDWLTIEANMDGEAAAFTRCLPM